MALTVGAAVRLHSLVSSPEENGQKGTCEEYNESTGRWLVTLESEHQVNVKPGNLEVIETGEMTPRSWTIAKETASFHFDLKAPPVKKLGSYYSTDPDGYSKIRVVRDGGIQTTHFDHGLYKAIAETMNDVGKITCTDLEEKIWHEIADGRGKRQELTCNERWTLRYGLGEFDWTFDARMKLFQDLPKLDVIGPDVYKKIEDVAVIKKLLCGPDLSELEIPPEKKAKGGGGSEIKQVYVDGMMLDRKMLIAAKEAIADDQVIDAFEAVKIFNAVAADNVFSRCERWTFRFLLSSHVFTDAAFNFLKEAFTKLPQNDDHTS